MRTVKLMLTMLAGLALLSCQPGTDGGADEPKGVQSSSADTSVSSAEKYSPNFEYHGAEWAEFVIFPNKKSFAVNCADAQERRERKLRMIGWPCEEGTEEYPLNTPRPGWKELTRGERLLLGWHKSESRTGVLHPLWKHRREAAKFAQEHGRVPGSLKELYPEAWERSLKSLQGKDLSHETWVQYAIYFDPIEGDLLEINPDEIEPGTFEFKDVQDPAIRKRVLRGLAGGHDHLSVEDADAAVIYFRAYGVDSRVIAEGYYPYWPAATESFAESAAKMEQTKQQETKTNAG